MVGTKQNEDIVIHEHYRQNFSQLAKEFWVRLV